MTSSLAQKCDIVPTPYDGFQLDNYGKINDAINHMVQARDTVVEFEMMLIALTYPRNKTIAYHIKVDTAREMHMYCIYIDSIKPVLINYEKKICLDSLYLTKDSGYNIYLSFCNDGSYSHESKVLLFFDHKTGKHIKYYSSDGRMLEALNQNKRYPFLEKIYDIISKAFQRLNLYQMQSFFPS